jgi:YbbR domain-containing protein
VLYNQPVTAIYNEEEYVVEGLPETVDITMIGTKANLYLANQLPAQVVSVDLSDLGVGFHQVDLKYKQAITSVEYKIDPSTVRVNISRKESVTKTITEDIINLDDLNSEFSVSSVKLSSDEVIVKGTSEKLANVSIIKALVNVDDLTDPHVGENKLKDIPIVAYDKDGQKIDIELVPNKVNATVNIESPSKEVPIVVKTKGLEDIVFGKSIASIETNVNTVTLYGNEETLDKIDEMVVEIKVNGLSENKKYTEQLKKPKNIRKLSTNTVTIEVKLGDEASTEVSDVNLSFRNLGDNLVVQAASDSINKVPVILKGTDSVISGITSSSIDAYVDLKGLTEGEHKVKINVVGSDNRVIYTPKITETKVIIIKK